MLLLLGGEWGGRKLHVPKSHALRPSAGRVKAAIFSILESYRMKQSLPAAFTGCRVLDLFAGIGGLGLEALSRGASRVVFVEKDRRHADCLKKNISELNAEERCTVLVNPVEHLESWHRFGPYDLVFLDPPYALPKLSSLLISLKLSEVLAKGAMVVFEHGPKDTVTIPSEFELHSERKLGPAGLSVFLCRR